MILGSNKREITLHDYKVEWQIEFGEIQTFAFVDDHCLLLFYWFILGALKVKEERALCIFNPSLNVIT
jgi:hypothetical protein